MAFIIGVALGDGNLSNPNGRAVRLRITCDTMYPHIIEEIRDTIAVIFPQNRVALVHRKKSHCLDISCYTNKWESMLGWKAQGGPKHKQGVRVPAWIVCKKEYSIACLRGLFLTDGSRYIDRGYQMVNFTTVIKPLADDIVYMITMLGFSPRIYTIRNKNKNRQTKYIIRVAKDATALCTLCNFLKS